MDRSKTEYLPILRRTPEEGVGTDVNGIPGRRRAKCAEWIDGAVGGLLSVRKRRVDGVLIAACGSVERSPMNC